MQHDSGFVVVSLHRRGSPRSHSKPWTYFVKNDQELAFDVDQGILQGPPHWDPILKGSKRTNLAFPQLLHRLGLLTWRKKATCRVGCFFGKKKDSMLRG